MYYLSQLLERAMHVKTNNLDDAPDQVQAISYKVFLLSTHFFLFLTIKSGGFELKTSTLNVSVVIN